MARVWKWFHGFEHGGLARSSSGDWNDNGFVQYMADVHIKGASAALDSLIADAASGDYGFENQQGLATPLTTAGHYEAYSQDWEYACAQVKVPLQVGAPIVSDTWALLRWTSDYTLGAGGTDYLGVGVKIITVGPPVTAQFNILKFASDGTFLADLGGNSASFNLPATSHAWVVLEMDSSTTTNNLKLYVNGTGGALVSSGTVRHDAVMMHDGRHVAGKGAGAHTMSPLFDDFATCDDSASSVPTAPAIQRYHPIANGSSNAWTAIGETVSADKHKNWNYQGHAGCFPAKCNRMYPTSDGQQQGVVFDDLAGGTIESVRVMWEQNGIGAITPHELWAKTTGAMVDLSAAVGYGESMYSFYTMCDGGALARWWGRQLTLDPHGNPWTTARFNALEVELKRVAASGSQPVGELYVMALGPGVTQPAQVVCPAGARRLPQVV
jgi:hypothetical protein